ncbi:PqiC family protein [Desulfocicer vacuolatum]|nr:PqiC family protein [Desulfocicer vacuolatum]
MHIRLVVFILLFCINAMGCQGKTPSVSFYALTPIAVPQNTSGGQGRLENVSIGIGPIHFPRTLQRPQIVTRPSANRLDLSEFHRWGGDLKQDFLNVLVQNISIITGSNQIFKYPWSPSFKPRYRVTLDVIQFDGRLGDTVLLNSIWEIKQGEPGNEKSEIKRSIIEQPISGEDYNALVKAKSDALKTLSVKITDKITVMDGT